MLYAECRNRLKAEDFAFIQKALSESEEENSVLLDLFKDEESRDSLLDHRLVYERLIDECKCLQVSSELYFYVLTRWMLKRVGIDDRLFADYIASVLVSFSQGANNKKIKRTDPSMGYHRPYISDMLALIQEAGSDEAFLIRSHIADYSLFISGIFADRVKAYQERRGGPDIGFYEGMGRANYHCASSHRLAKDSDLEEVFGRLSEQFHEVRCALNHLADNHLHFEGPDQDLLIISS